MELTREELAAIAYNPAAMQKMILDLKDKATNGEVVITDASNPFTMLIEATAVTSANSSLESKNVIRKKYANLALTREHLYHHISDDELANMFAIPAETSLVFYVNVLDIKSQGYRPTGANFVETTIPFGTEITVRGVALTLLNDIIVKLYDNGSVFVEQMNTDNLDISIENLGVLQSGITTGSDSVSWIIFETKVKQVKKTSKTITASAAEGFNEVIPLNNKYFYSDVSYKNAAVNNQYVKLAKSHSEEYIDSTTPTVYINLLDDSVNFKIPDVYLVDSGVSGNVVIDVYETAGEIYLPINKYEVTDFNIVLGDTGKTPSSSTSVNIAIMANSRSILEGGVDGMTVEELRNSIIFNTSGDIDLPITNYQISRYGNMQGYDVFKILDVVTERLFTAVKGLPKVDHELILSKQDIFFNTSQVILSDLTTNNKININNDNFVIKSGTVFKEDNNIITIVHQDKLAEIELMTNAEKIQYFKDNKYFYTPYYYIINRRDGYTASKVYDLDRPKMESLRIVAKNTLLPQRVNIDKFTITKTDSGYRVYITLISNDDFKKLDQSLVKIQMSLSLKGDSVNVYFDSVYDATNGYYIFDIQSGLFIDEDNYIDVLNGSSSLFTKTMSIENEATFYIYSSDETLNDPNDYLVNELYISDNKNYTVFSKEKVNIELGRELEYIWNRLYNSYTERKFKTYDHSVPLVHLEDEYEVFEDTGTTMRCKIINGETEVVRNLLHKKGDPVLDTDGNQVYKYQEGDVILDQNGLPIVDEISGLVRFIDIMMLEYEYKIANARSYINYSETVLDVLESYLLEDLKDINDKMLENTKVLYKSYKTSKPITININNVYYSVPYSVRPKLTLYANRGISISSPELNSYRDRAGKVIDEFLTKNRISLTEMRDAIKTELGENIIAVKVSGIDVNDSEVVTINDDTTRLVLGKALDLNENTELVVKYDIEMSVQYL